MMSEEEEKELVVGLDPEPPPPPGVELARMGEAGLELELTDAALLDGLK